MFGPPILRPASLRDFYAFEGHVGTMWSDGAARSRRPGTACRSSTSATPARSAGPDEPVWAPGGSVELDYELEVARSWTRPAVDLAAERAEEAIGGYRIFNDWSARDLQREETAVRLGPRRARTSRAPSVRGWSRPMNWPMAVRAPATTWR